MTKKLLLTFALLLTAVTGARANEYLYFEISETSATMKYGENFWGKPYYDERADWWINDSSWDGRENIKTITVDASCQNINQENLSGLFYGFTNLETITNIDKLNTANVLDMSRLFQGCSSLSTLDLSDWNTSKVTDMSSMFYGCTSLTTLNIIGWDTSNVTNTESMFNGCSSLASISFPASLTTIGDFAFQGCTSLATVTVYAPDCTLGDNAFDGCSNLTNIYVFSDLVSQYQTNWNAYAGKITAMTPVASGECGKDNPGDVTWRLEGEAGHYRLIISGTGAMADYASSSDQPWKDYRSSIKTVVIGAGVTSIGNYAFYYCTGLTSIEIPASVTTIGGYAFRSCSNLATVTFAEGSQLTSIGTSAFANTGLTSIEIPASVTSIGNSAFNNTGLTSINIPASVTSISNNAFINCSNLEAMTVDGENAVYDSRDNCNAIIEISSNTLIAGCKNTTIPDDVTIIRDYAFNGCTGLTSIEIPANVTNIGVSAFQGCSGLTSIEIPTGVTIIGVSTFQGCSGLTSIVIPAGVTRIGGTVFKNCSDLATVTVYAPSCTLGNDAFENCNKLTNIYVLSDRVNNYKNATNWESYKSKITAMEMDIPHGKCGDVRWVFTNYTLTITGTGAMADYDNYDDQPWYDYAENIKTIVIGNGVTSIGKNAFNGCYNLATVTFAAGSQLETIGESAFNGCSGLASITIPASVTGIGDGAFDGCSNLATVSFSAGSQLKAIGNYAFSLSGLASIEIPANVTSIGDGAFANCSGLATVTFAAGSQLETIGEGAFNGTGLASIEIPANVTSIGDFAFANTCLTSIEIPASVTGIGMNAFNGCYNLATVTVYAPSCTLGSSAFDLCGNDLKIYVFSDLVDDYQAATNWSAYEGKITAIPTVTTSYVDADGTLHENVEAVPLNNAMTTLPTGTYVVNSDVTFSGNLSTNVSSSGEVNIILCDGATLTASNITPNGHSDKLRFYGQSQGTGTANISGDIEATQSLNIYGGTIIATKSIICRTGSVVIYGGNVTVAAIDGMYGSNFTGGTITADEIEAGSDGPIILGGATVTADSYSAQKGVTIATGITYYDGEGHVYNAGNLSTDEITAIAGKTLRPVTGVTLTKEGDNVSATFDGTSTTTVYIPNDETVNGVIYNRTFTEGKPSTVMLPFSLGSGQTLTGGTLYKFTGVTKNETTGKWEATMTETTTLQANTPYLLLPDENLVNGKVTFNLNNSTVTLNTKGGGDKETADQGSHWTFKGTYEYMKWTTDTSDPDYNADRAAEIGKVYGFAGVAKTGIEVGDFVKVASGAKIRPMGCYLLWSDTPNASRAAARGAATEELPQSITVRLVGSNGEITAIGEIDTKTGEMTFDSEAWYTLNGVRLSGKPTKKGLYINNGRKVVVK